MEPIFRLDLDIKPSELLVGTPDVPVEFEWFSEVYYFIYKIKKGLCVNTFKVLNEFWKKHSIFDFLIINRFKTNQNYYEHSFKRKKT